MSSVQNGVYVIRYAKGKYKGQLVGVAESPTAAMAGVKQAELHNEIVRLWVHRAGLAPETAANFSAEWGGLVGWAELKGASEPINPSHGAWSQRQVAEVVDELRVCVCPATLRTDEESRVARARAKELCRRLGVSDHEEAFERYGKYPATV
jgi:hypothetical protein